MKTVLFQVLLVNIINSIIVSILLMDNYEVLVKTDIFKYGTPLWVVLLIITNIIAIPAFWLASVKEKE